MREVQGRGTNVIIPHEGELNQINQKGFITQLMPGNVGKSCNKDGERDRMLATEFIPVKPYSTGNEWSFMEQEGSAFLLGYFQIKALN